MNIPAPPPPELLKKSPESANPSFRWYALLGIGLYLASPWVPALDLNDQAGNAGQYPGWPLLFFGWAETWGLVSGRFQGIAWLANPFFVVGTTQLLIGRFWSSSWTLITAMILAFGSCFLKEVPLDEGGTMSNVVGYKLGFWLWIGAIFVNLLIALLLCSKNRKTGPKK